MTETRDARPTMLRSLAERAALHPRMEQAVVGAVMTAVHATLPGVIEALLVEEADRQFGTLRIYMRKVPAERRQERDRRVQALLNAGLPPERVAEQAGCSRRHVYRIRAQLRAFRPG